MAFRTPTSLVSLVLLSLAVSGCEVTVTEPAAVPPAADLLIARETPVASATSGYLVDTGPGPSTITVYKPLYATGGAASGFFYVAGRFTLSDDADITSVSLWMHVYRGGVLTTTIRTDAGGLPGAELASSQSTISSPSDPATISPGWRTFGLSAELPAGTYWVTFEPRAGDGFYAGMTYPVPTPLDAYAASCPGCAGWSLFANQDVGIRVAGSDGGSSSGTVRDRLNDLMAAVLALDLNALVAGDLTRRLEKVASALADGKEYRACAQLRVFVNTVDVYSRVLPSVTPFDPIAVADATALVAGANTMMDELGCNPPAGGIRG